MSYLIRVNKACHADLRDKDSLPLGRESHLPFCLSLIFYFLSYIFPPYFSTFYLLV